VLHFGKDGSLPFELAQQPCLEVLVLAENVCHKQNTLAFCKEIFFMSTPPRPRSQDDSVALTENFGGPHAGGVAASRTGRRRIGNSTRRRRPHRRARPLGVGGDVGRDSIR
jgi:hypothetical protein